MLLIDWQDNARSGRKFPLDMSNLNDTCRRSRIFTAQLGMDAMDGRKLRFLVVENEYLIAIDAGQLLAEAFDCEVEVATSGELADFLSDGRWDVVFLDTAGNGADAARADLVLARASAVVFLTGYNDLAPGVAGYPGWPVVMKPFSLETLRDAVLAILERNSDA